MTRRAAFALGSALVLMIVTATPASAATNVLTKSVSITTGPVWHCGGSNTLDPYTVVRTVGVSYVCQKRDSSGVWRDIGTAPSWTCSDCAGTGYHETTVGCGTLGRGTWSIRAQVDGWHVHYNGTRHDTAAVATTAKTATCP